VLKLPKQAMRAAAKRKFDRWMGAFGLANATSVARQLQKLLREEKKRRKELEK